jgi:hypothetical protein
MEPYNTIAMRSEVRGARNSIFTIWKKILNSNLKFIACKSEVNGLNKIFENNKRILLPMDTKNDKVTHWENR